VAVNRGWVYRDRVDGAAAGCTLLEFYSDRYRHSSRAEWHDRIEAGQIRVDGRLAMPETRLQAGQQLSYHRPPWQEPAVPLGFRVCHADDDLIVVEKPSGLPVLPGGGFLDHTLLHQLQRQFPDDTPYPIHRLGRGTSGLVLLARSRRARAVLSDWMRAGTAGDRRIHKTYLALIGPAPELPERLTVTQPIGPVDYPQLGTIHAASAVGKPALSEVTVLRRWPDRTLVEVAIATGRPHQIRIHLASLGYPLLGDLLYGPGGVPRGTEAVPGDCGYWLHAWRLRLPHPITGQPLALEAEPPTSLDPDQP
jgi:23S rRNA pseudouridine1911/1915/1917 synthase